MLRDAQAAIGRHVLTRDADPAVAAAFVLPDGVDAAERLSIHRNNVMGSLIEALGDTFPAVARHCGARNFEAAAAAFVRGHPPDRAQLSHYGAAFPRFLDGFAPAQRDLPFLADLARLEWALNEAYFAAEAAPLAPETLGALPPERLDDVRFVLHPATRIVASAHPVLRLWRDPECSAPLAEDDGRHVLVVRPEAAVEAQPIGAGDHALLAAFEGGAGLSAALDAALAADDGFDLQAALGRHLVQGTFCAARLPDGAETTRTEGDAQ